MTRLPSNLRLQGHINLKLCVGLASVALAGVLVIKTPAQTTSLKKDCADCGTSDKAQPENVGMAQYGASPLATDLSDFNGDPLDTGVVVAEKDRGPEGLSLPASTGVPKGVTIVGIITGPLVDLKTDKIVRRTLVADHPESADYSLIKTATYQMTAVIRSTKANLTSVSIGGTGTKQEKVGLGEGKGTTLSVTLSNAAKAIYISGDIEAATLLQKGANWRVTTTPQKVETLAIAKTEVFRDGVKARCVMGGSQRFLRCAREGSIHPQRHRRSWQRGLWSSGDHLWLQNQIYGFASSTEALWRFAWNSANQFHVTRRCGHSSTSDVRSRIDSRNTVHSSRRLRLGS